MTASLPAYLQQYEAPDVGAALSANLGSAVPPHVSIGGGRFTLIDAGNNEIPVPTFDPQIGVYLDACIVDVNSVMSRVYFAGTYDPNAEGTRPDCFSDNGVGPSVSAASPQAPTCAACPQAAWGSKINANGKKVPACSSKQKVALLIPGFNTLFLLAVPPNSHGPMREYVEKCKGSGVNLANLITRISFVPGVQGTLQFQPVTYIDEPTAKLRAAAYAEKKTDALVGRNDVARAAGAIAAPVQQPQAVQPVQQIAPPVQQPAPFALAAPAPAAALQTTMPTTPQGSPPWPSAAPSAPAPTMPGPAGTVPAASPSDPAPTTRRRRRTAAEMAAANGGAPAAVPANGAAPAGQPSPAPAAAPQAPFPVQGQTAAAAPAANGSFGIAEGQPAAANPELAGMLDDFFKG